MISFRLEENSWQDVAAYLEDDNRIIIPVGSTEQHGTFAPLGTDTHVALAVAEEGAERSGVLMAPPLWYGWSPHHLVVPGTVSIRAEILIELFFDLVSSLARHGFRLFVVINGHRLVNIPWLQISAQRIQEELGVRVYLFDLAHMAKEVIAREQMGSIGHGDEQEISHMMHCSPELLRPDRFHDAPHPERTLYHLDPGSSRDSLCYVPATINDMEKLRERTGDTITGSPTRATPEKGRIYHQHLVSRLLELLQHLGNS
ncbi:hypothetical protein GF1_04480 [Desulfolithobacter dissulfuricans]|uniref:Creatininase n=1 Tax=Desulfolithobacter dissulfuricans TaxID=2795293 RepID=A0A915U0C4_9BACT|nr:creatininase family protein [Desulfolithobacter dissulfuricans]BCO08072.1 hypothetical protein GF1_04480 [Desulfolithobacter dissulfuricans]